MEFVLEKGKINKIVTDSFNIGFSRTHGIGIFMNGEEIVLSEIEKGSSGIFGGMKFNLEYWTADKSAVIHLHIQNTTEDDIDIRRLSLRTGIDCYMEKYPEWNEKFFPTLIRCEKTHLWGYFEGPSGNAFAIATMQPVASYHLEYNKLSGGDFGHRIYTAVIDLFADGKLPERHPQNMSVVAANAEYDFDLHIIPLADASEVAEKIYITCGIPMITAEKYLLDSGELPNIKIFSDNDRTILWEKPNGKADTKLTEVAEPGIYTLTVRDKNNKVSQAKLYCRMPWNEYIKAARREALYKPQKASTHCESWYGFFSGFLAAKHYPDAFEDNAINLYFDEILPLIWDRNKKHPKTAPDRIQNMAALVSVLVDKYWVNPKNNAEDLYLASEIGDFIMSKQADEGAYKNGNIHYTCVIYIAKSMLELAEAERQSGEAHLQKQGEIHYYSAKRAVDDLVNNLECIGTEGEHTLEDGMISCSALQIAMFALTLPEEERGEYIEAAEHMMNIHSCLEQRFIPDCRMNGGSLRFWEAQYDVMIKANFVNSPHGWSAWTTYAKHYLYLLTGNEHYLIEMLNSMGACVQLMDTNGNLRWAFAADPQICAEVMVPDHSSPLSDGYASTMNKEPAFRGRYEKRTFGEEYIEMVSGWYRAGTQKVMGGYEHCPLIDEKGDFIKVDNQGGACDNDVHEIFKCMEEVILKKVYLHECDDGHFISSSCRYENNYVILTEEAECVLYCLKNDICLRYKNKETVLKATNGKVCSLHLS